MNAASSTRSAGAAAARRACLHLLEDCALEQHIAECTRRMEAAYTRYEHSGSFADRGEADRWRIEMEQAIRRRSPRVVGRMEQEMGGR